MRGWTPYQLQLLEVGYNTMTNAELAKRVGKSASRVGAMKSKLRKVKFERVLWSQDEIEFLQKNYQKLNDSAIGFILNRTRNSVKEKMHQLNLSRDKKGARIQQAQGLITFTQAFNKIQREVEAPPALQQIDLGNGQYMLVPEGTPQSIIDAKKKKHIYKINI